MQPESAATITHLVITTLNSINQNMQHRNTFKKAVIKTKTLKCAANQTKLRPTALAVCF